MPVASFERLDFCPSCKTSYESTQQSEFSRVFSLGTEGRASAITVLTQSVVRALRHEPDPDEEARKFLSFTDNRQDASLQAGHFNDFVLVGLVRSALYQQRSNSRSSTRRNRSPTRTWARGSSRRSAAIREASPETETARWSSCLATSPYSHRFHRVQWPNPWPFRAAYAATKACQGV
jgi:hypothetical protein